MFIGQKYKKNVIDIFFCQLSKSYLSEVSGDFACQGLHRTLFLIKTALLCESHLLYNCASCFLIVKTIQNF